MLAQRYVVDEAKEERYRRAAELRTAMANLSRCLRDGAALCAAYYAGWSARIAFVNGYPYASPSTTWHPGCGWPMPEVG